MDVYLLTLRIAHIVSGVFWVGSAWSFFSFIEPTAAALGPDSQKFMHHLVARRRITTVITWASTINVVAGVLLYWRISNGLDPGWMFSSAGIGFTFGGIAAIAAWLIGLTLIAPNVRHLDAMGVAMAGAGRPPTSDELGRFGGTSGLLHRLGQLDALLLLIAVLGMAVGRYLR